MGGNMRARQFKERIIKKYGNTEIFSWSICFNKWIATFRVIKL